MSLCCNNMHPLLLRCFPIFFTCVSMIRSASGSVSDPLMVITVSFWSKSLSVFRQNNQFGGSISHVIKNVRLLCKDMHPLLLECYLTSLICINIIQSASDSISNPLMVLTVFFFPKHSQFWGKIINLGSQIIMGNMTLYRKDMYPLLLECFPTSIRCISMIGSASDSICDPLVVVTVSFLPKTLSIFKQNNQFWVPDQSAKYNAVL